VVEEASASASQSVALDESQFEGAGIASAICSLGITRQLITGYFVDHLRRHFAGELGIGEYHLRDLIWKLTDDTGILVESIWKWKPETTEKRPGILVKPNAYTNFRASFGDQLHGGGIDREGNPRFETFWIGSHTVFCIGRKGAETEILGAEVQRELTQMASVICRCLGLQKYHVREIGAISEIEEAKENFVVPITIAIAYSESWTIRALAPVLRGVTLSSLLDC
jgi:hypothetical protein